MKRRGCGWSTLVGALSLAVAGCANSPFYNEARDKQGQALTKATSEVDLQIAVNELDKRFNALRELEAQTLSERLGTSRDLEIAKAVSKGADGTGTLRTRYVKPLIDDRLARLLGKAPEPSELDKALEQVVVEEHFDRQVDSALRTFNAMSGLRLASCTAARKVSDETGRLQAKTLADVSQPRRSSAQALFEDLLKKCKASGDAISPMVSADGLLGSATRKRDEALKAARDYDDNVAKHRRDFERLDSALEAETAALDPKKSDSTASARLASAAERLQAGIDALRSAATLDPDAFAHAEASERLEALGSVVDAVASGRTDLSALTVDQRRSVRFIRFLPGVADEADRLFKESKKPRLGPLLLAKEQQRLAVEAFAAKADLLRRYAAIRQQQVEAARGEVLALAKARRVLGPPPPGVPGVSVDLDKPFEAVVADGGNEGRRRAALYESIAYYFDQALHYRAQAELLDLSANGVGDDLVMLQSRSAAKMWNSLLKNMAAIVAEYHAAGVKPGELAEFLKGFGLVYIGSQAGK